MNVIMNGDMTMNTNRYLDRNICICIGMYAHESPKNGYMTCKYLCSAKETKRDRVANHVRFNVIMGQERD